MRDLRLSGAVLAAVLLAACNTPKARPHIVLIVVDALRADRVGPQAGPSLTPAIDRLAARATTFRRAYATSSWTIPSTATLFTSRYPSQHGINVYSSLLAGEELTLAEVFQQHGYRGAAFVGNLLVSSGFGYGQGFETFVGVHAPADALSGTHKPRGNLVTEACLSWLRQQAPAAGSSPPIFLYLHYMETHTPYTPPPATVDRMLGRHGDPTVKRAALADMLFRSPVRWNQPDPVALEVMNDLYDAEVSEAAARSSDSSPASTSWDTSGTQSSSSPPTMAKRFTTTGATATAIPYSRR